MRAPRGIGRLGGIAAALAALAGCSAPPGGEAASGQAEAQPIECALAGAAAFSRDCTVERTARDGVRFVVVRRPDGGFRRFVQQADGGLALADGANAAKATLAAGAIEVAIGADRYRIPLQTVPQSSSPSSSPAVASHAP